MTVVPSKFGIMSLTSPHPGLGWPPARMVLCQLQGISYLCGAASGSRCADGCQQAGQAKAVIAMHVRNENVVDGTRINARHCDLPVCALTCVNYQRLARGAQSYAGHVSPLRWRTCWRQMPLRFPQQTRNHNR